MNKKTKRIALIVTFILTMVFAYQVNAEDIGVGFPHETCISDINGEANIQEGNCDDMSNFMLIMQDFVGAIMGLSGSVAVALIVYGGFRYIMAGGNPKEVEEAKKVIFYAGLGLFVVLSAFMIISMVFGALTK